MRPAIECLTTVRNGLDRFQDCVPLWAQDHLRELFLGSRASSRSQFVLIFCSDLAAWSEQLVLNRSKPLIAEKGLGFLGVILDGDETSKSGAPHADSDQVTMQSYQVFSEHFSRVTWVKSNDFSDLNFWGRIKTEFNLELSLSHSTNQDRVSKFISAASEFDVEDALLQQNKSIEESSRQLRKIVEKERSQSQYLSRLLEAQSFESVLSVIRRELFKVESFIDMHWLQLDRDQEVTHLGFHHGVWQAKVVPFIQGAAELAGAFKSEAYRNHWSKLLSRPVGHFQAISFNDKKGYHHELRDGYLVLEASNAEAIVMMTEEHRELFDYAKISWLRFGLESLWTSLAGRWQKTYESFHDPLIFIDSNFKIVMSNKPFDETKTCYQNLFNFSSPCDGCPMLGSYEGADQRKIGHPTEWIEVSTYEVIPSLADKTLVHLNHYQNLSSEKRLVAEVAQLEKMAEMGILAESIAHEINNPLSGILGLSQMMLADLAPDRENKELYTDIHEIQKAAIRSHKVIKALMDFTKMGTFGDRQIMSLRAIVENTLPLMKTLLRSHRVEIDLQEADDFVLVQPALLQQVIFNLVKNASQAMEKAGLVKIQTEVAGDEAILRIGDSGKGIPQADLALIFQPFFTTKKEGEGTGIGLGFVKKVVEDFSGTITCDSEVGIGTTFSARFPLSRSQPT